MQNIWKVKVNINEYYFSTEEKALNFINNKIILTYKNREVNTRCKCFTEFIIH